MVDIIVFYLVLGVYSQQVLLEMFNRISLYVWGH